MIIAVDFDGTIVEHLYPAIGQDVPYAIKTLADLIANGHKIILYTMRSDTEPTGKLPDNIKPYPKGRKPLTEAVDYLKARGIILYGVNENPTQKEWTSSPKVYADLYIDDSALGCPLKKSLRGMTVVDWLAVRRKLIKLL